jgi:hypothetical protein
MEQEGTGQGVSDDLRMVSAALVREMLANLQEAVVTSDQGTRRGLVKGVIAQLQDVLVGQEPG